MTITDQAPAGSRGRATPGGPDGGRPLASGVLLPGGSWSVARTGLLAFFPAALAALLVFGLRHHRPDLETPGASAVVVLVGAAGWVSMLAAATVADGWRQARARGAGEAGLARLAVPAVGAVYLLVAFGVLVRLRLVGLEGSPDHSLTALVVSLGLGTLGLVALASWVRALPIGEPDPESRALQRWWSTLFSVVAFAVVVLAAVDRGVDPLTEARPAVLVPVLIIVAFAFRAALAVPHPDGWSPRFTDGLLLLGVALGPVLDPRHPVPIIAAVVGVAVLLVVATDAKPIAVTGAVAVAVLFYVAAIVVFDELREPRVIDGTPEGVDLYGSAALARGGWFGSGPGNGLVEAYAHDGAVPDRFALAVVVEELGVAGLLVLLLVVFAAAVYLVRLARHAGSDAVGAAAKAVAAATVVTLALPALPVLVPGFAAEVTMPAVAADPLALVVLLCTVGALVGAAARGQPAAETREPGAVAATPPASKSRPGRWLLMVLAGVVVLVLVLQVALAGAAGRDTDNQGAVDAANDLRPVAALSWAPLLEPPTVDDTTRAKVDAAFEADRRRQCPALSPAGSPGFDLGPSCSDQKTVTSTLDEAAQTEAYRAITFLPQGRTGTAIAIDVSDGRLLVLTSGQGSQQPPSRVTAPPSRPAWADAAPAGLLGQLLIRAALPEDTEANARVLYGLRNFYLNGLLDDDDRGDRNDKEDKELLRQVGLGREGEQDVHEIVNDLLSPNPKHLEDAKKWIRMVDGEILKTTTDKERKVTTDPRSCLTFDASQTGITFFVGGDFAGTGAATEYPCGRRLTDLLNQTVSPEDRRLRSLNRLQTAIKGLDAKLGLGSGAPAAHALMDEGLGGYADGVSTSPAPLQAGKVDPCEADVTGCLSLSPLQLAVAFAGLLAADGGEGARLPVPYLIDGDVLDDRPVAGDLRGMSKLFKEGKIPESFNVAAGADGTWSAQVTEGRDGHQVVVVGFVAAQRGVAPNVTAAKPLTQAVVDAIHGD